MIWKCHVGVEYETWVQTKQATPPPPPPPLTQRLVCVQSPQQSLWFFNNFTTSSIVFLFIFGRRLFGDHVCGQRMNKPFLLYSSTENKGGSTSCLCVKMLHKRAIRYCGLWRWDQGWSFKQSEPPAVSHFLFLRVYLRQPCSAPKLFYGSSLKKIKS